MCATWELGKGIDGHCGEKFFVVVEMFGEGDEVLGDYAGEGLEGGPGEWHELGKELGVSGPTDHGGRGSD